MTLHRYNVYVGYGWQGQMHKHSYRAHSAEDALTQHRTAYGGANIKSVVPDDDEPGPNEYKKQPGEDHCNPIRNISTEQDFLTMLQGNGETESDIVDWTAPTWRGANFTCGVIMTKRHLYTLYQRDWLDDGAITTRVFCTKLTEAPP